MLSGNSNFEVYSKRMGRKIRSSDFSYDGIKKLASIQVFPPRNPNKPLTPFSIKDILTGNRGSDKPADHHRAFVRPWDSVSTNSTSSGQSSGRDDNEEDEDDDDIEIDIVNTVTVKDKNKPSPLDALLKMTSKTFEGLDPHGNPREGNYINLHFKFNSKIS